MSTPQDQLNALRDQAAAAARADVAKAEAWFKRWYYQVSIGAALGALLGHVLWR